MANISLGFRLLLLIGLSLALPLVEHDGDAIDKPHSYIENADEIIAHPGFIKDPSQEEEDPDFQEYFRSVSELVAKAPSEPSEEDKILATWTPNSAINPDEAGEYLGGDIVTPKKSASRTGLTATSSKWPSGVVPYEIDKSFTPVETNKILNVFRQFVNITCMNFTRRTNQKDYIRVTSSNTGCWSFVGRVGGKQDVNLQSPLCLAQDGSIIHELMHALGFIHEQNRSDRDDYVTISLKNVKDGYESNFDKAKPNTTDSFGVAYDYDSVMHNSGYAYTKNGQPTIVPKGNIADIGNRDHFSVGDIAKLRITYGC